MIDLAVIMAVYQNDKLKFFEESVKSILDQTHRDFHLYLVSDGPVSPAISNYLKGITDARLRLFYLEINWGLARALNFLLEKVLDIPDYVFIARMDADDISYPDRFKKQREFLLENLEISCVGSWYHEIDESGKILSDRRMPVSHEAINRSFCYRTPVAHPTVMFRRNLIADAGFYPTDTVFMEDTVLWGRALKHGLKFANIPKYLLKFRRDREFYKRRSGIRYGWNYIKTRIGVNKTIHSSFFCCIISFFIGIIKMMPSHLIEFFYYTERRIRIFK